MANELQTAKSKFVALQGPHEQLARMVDQALGGDGLTWRDLRRFKVPTGEGMAFTEAGSNEMTPELSGILIFHQRVRRFYADPLSGSSGGKARLPDCFSCDTKFGVVSDDFMERAMGAGKSVDAGPGGECKRCRFSKWGSIREIKATSPDDRAQACQLRHLVYLIPEGEILPVMLSIPPTGVEAFRKRVTMRCLTKMQPYYYCVLRLTLVPGPKGALIRFEIAGELEGEDAARAEALNTWLAPSLEMTDDTMRRSGDEDLDEEIFEDPEDGPPT